MKTSGVAEVGARPVTSGRVAVYFAVRYLTPVVVLFTLAVSGAQADRARVSAILSAQMAGALLTHVIAMRNGPMRTRAIMIGMGVDVAALATLMMLTGGITGPISFLFSVHAIAVGVLLSSRYGLRMLVMASLAIIAVDITGRSDVTAPGLLPSGMVALASLWVVGGCATLFSGYNERELRRQNAELTTVRQITLDIEDSLSLPRVLADLCRGVTEGFRFDAALVLARSGDGDTDDGNGEIMTGDTMIGVAGEGMTGALGTSVEVRGRLEEALAADGPMVVGGDLARRDGTMVPMLGPRGYVAVPIAEDHLLVVSRSGRRGRPGKVHQRELETLEGLAHHARLAIANARLHQRVAAMAITDPLTKLANHGEFQRRFMAEMGRLQRYSSLRGESHRLSVIMLDIDKFKTFNDTYGHQAGDETLRTIARVIEGAVRSFDLIARYGGEEFAVILPETPRESALTVAERIRSSVEAHPFGPIDGRTLRVTVSIGVATAPEDGSTPKDLIGRADRALYASKANGRNQVTHADTLGQSTMADVVQMKERSSKRRSTDKPRQPRSAAKRSRR